MENILSSEFITLASIVLIAVGFLKFILYYKAFRIPIIEYIEPGEVISLFADNIATSVLAMFVLFIPYIKVIGYKNFIRDNLHMNFIQRLNVYVSLLNNLIVIGLIFLSVVVFITWKRPKINNFEIVTYITGWIILVFVIPILVFEANIYLEIDAHQSSIAAVSLLISFVFLVLLATRNEIRKVKRFNYYDGVIVNFEHEKIISNSNNLFVGKTKSFVFFYSVSDKVSTAYSSDKLKSISYPH